jgi:hypothetical protein
MTDSYKPHPEDEWVEVTPPGESEPRYVLARSGAAAEVAKARAKYLAGQISIQEFEIVLNRLMK